MADNGGVCGILGAAVEQGFEPTSRTINKQRANG